MVLESRHRTQEQDGPVRAVTVSARRAAEMEMFKSKLSCAGLGAELDIAAVKNLEFFELAFVWCLFCFLTTSVTFVNRIMKY